MGKDADRMVECCDDPCVLGRLGWTAALTVLALTLI